MLCCAVLCCAGCMYYTSYMCCIHCLDCICLCVYRTHLSTPYLYNQYDRFPALQKTLFQQYAYWIDFSDAMFEWNADAECRRFEYVKDVDMFRGMPYVERHNIIISFCLLYDIKSSIPFIHDCARALCVFSSCYPMSTWLGSCCHPCLLLLSL